MKKQNKLIAVTLLGLLTIWDTTTTVFGTIDIIGVGGIQYFISMMFGVIISTFLVLTIPILTNPKEEIIPMVFKGLWFLALGYDLYTSWNGNQTLLTNNTSNPIAQIAITIGMTIFVSSSSIAISYIWWEIEDL